MTRGTFGSYSRAADGCIVTFRMPDGSVNVKHFASIVKTKTKLSRQRQASPDRRYVDLVIEWAESHDAKIICMSSPETILRDLQGTRAMQKVKPTGHGTMQKHPPDVVHFPERVMLKGRTDLLEAPSSGSIDDRSRSIKSVRQWKEHTT